MEQPTPTPAPKRPSVDLHIPLDLRVLCLLLLVVIAVMLVIWRPWQMASARTITVLGEATIQHAPDSFVFSPRFEAADMKKVTVLGNDAVAALKKLGVQSSELKTDVNAGQTFPQPQPLSQKSGGTSAINQPAPIVQSASYDINITVHDKALAQKVADYLATTTASGQLTPLGQFQIATRSKLDIQARTLASSDARTKAEAMVSKLGGHVGRLVSVSENGYNVMPMMEGKGASIPDSAASAGPVVEPGTDDVNYNLTVVFELK